MDGGPSRPTSTGWTVAGDSYEEVRQLVDDGVTFALASAAEDRGDGFDEGRFADVAVEHFVPAPT